MNHPETLEGIKVAQSVLDTHKAIACAEDWRICQSNMPVYKASRKLLIATIRQVFGMSDLMAWRVYDVWNDCMEDIQYCVEYVRTNRLGSSWSNPYTR